MARYSRSTARCPGRPPRRAGTVRANGRPISTTGALADGAPQGLRLIQGSTWLEASAHAGRTADGL
jgi:hypothetical protein